MRVAQIVPSLEDRHGGPSRSVRAIANAQARLGANVQLLTTGAPLAPSPADAAVLRFFPRVFPQRLSRAPQLAAHLASHHYDCLHYHSLWLLPLRYAVRAAQHRGVPLVLSPRGMMTEWAWNHHRRRKQLAERFVHPGAFQAAAGWHATSEDEANDIRRLGFTQPICVAPNGVDVPETAALETARQHWQNLCPALRGRRVALFYSRFHRKKRVRELIDLWLSQPREDWLLLIVGLPEEYTVADLTAEVRAAGATERIVVFDGAGQPPPYAVASLFLLPSHSENFGLVIAESLAAGVPALVTDTTPWLAMNLKRAGWCAPWTAYNTALSNALAQPAATLAEMGAIGRHWAGHDFGWEKPAQKLLEFYQTLTRAR
ncbi:MAG TPA: glycosyltransferase [Candidatus Didemnitutus sp.]|nr:glycosyltransferase [Candidatus Didemnitutus sp.]